MEILTLLLVQGKVESATRLIRRNVADKRSCLITKRDYSRYFHDQFHFVEIWWTFDFSDRLLGHEEYFQSAGYVFCGTPGIPFKDCFSLRASSPITVSEARRERTRAFFLRPSRSRLLSRAALAWLPVTPPNGELALRLGLSYCVVNW